MKILLDENLAKKLRTDFGIGLEVKTVLSASAPADVFSIVLLNMTCTLYLY